MDGTPVDEPEPPVGSHNGPLETPAADFIYHCFTLSADFFLGRQRLMKVQPKTLIWALHRNAQGGSRSTVLNWDKFGARQLFSVELYFHPRTQIPFSFTT